MDQDRHQEEGDGEEEEEEEHNNKHVCRFCGKSFSNGKVLGGHMRCHVSKNPKKLAKKLREDPITGIKKSYGLRVNPKKSSRVSVSLLPSLITDHRRYSPPAMAEEIPCRVCGKAFETMRALFGHMRHHSTKRKRNHEEEEEDNGHETLAIGDKLLAAVESSGIAKKKRSSRKSRSSNKLVALTESCSVSNSSLVEIDRGDVEEIALSLLMLSRGVRNLEFLENPNGFLEDKKPFEEEEKEGRECLSLISVSDHQRIEYKCRTCNKAFHSHQALGGHQTIHRLIKPCNAEDLSAEAVITEAENSETGIGKEHKCPICFKVFGSGQALGGHKRAHMVKDTAEIGALTGQHEKCGNSVHHLLVGGPEIEIGTPWWIRNNHSKHEFLLGLVPN